MALLLLALGGDGLGGSGRAVSSTTTTSSATTGAASTAGTAAAAAAAALAAISACKDLQVHFVGFFGGEGADDAVVDAVVPLQFLDGGRRPGVVHHDIKTRVAPWIL